MKSKLLALAIVLGVAAVCCLQACKKSGQTGAAADTKSSGPASSTPAVELKTKWPVGNNYTYRLDLTQNTKMQIPGMPQPLLQEVTMAQTYSLDVLKERPNGGREIDLTFVAMEMDFKMGDMTMNFDSKTDTGADNNPFVAPYRKMTGSKLKMLLDDKGQVELIENLDEWQNTILAGSPPQVEAMIRGTYSPAYFRQLVETSKGLPARPVKVGESWPFQTEVPTGPVGKISLDLTVMLKGFEQHDNRQCALLESSGKIKGTGGGAAGPMGKMSIAQGKVSGKTWFDPELGAMVGVDSDQKMQLKIEPTGGVIGDNKPLSGEVSQNVAIKLVELNKANK